jgi:ABC-type lipoprotein release transport system permease subunit
MLIGLVIGYTVCIVQFYGKFIKMPDSMNETFPIQMKFSDAILIVSLVLSLSLFVSYFPVKLLLRKEYGKDSYKNEKS